MSQLSHAQFPLRRHPNLLVDHRRNRSAAVAEPRGANGEAVTGSGGRLHFGMVAGIKSERWPTSNRNPRPDCLGIRTSCRSLFSIASFPSATSSIVWSGPTPIRDAANYGCPSFAAPTGDRRWTLMGLIGSGMRLLAVTGSKPPAEHPVSRMTRPDVRLSLVRAPALPPPHADFGSQFHTPSNRCLRFGPRVAATPARLAPVPPARL